MDCCENEECGAWGNAYSFNCGNFMIAPKKCKDYLTTQKEPVADVRCNGGLNRIAELEDELRVTDHLLSERQRVLDAIPECEVHGPCVPHALEWIEKAKKRDAV